MLQRDIDTGLDPSIGGWAWLDQHARGVSLRINQPVPTSVEDRALRPGDDPLRIGRTSLVVYSPFGSSTSGTLYVAAAQGPQMAVRLYGATGRTRRADLQQRQQALGAVGDEAEGRRQKAEGRRQKAEGPRASLLPFVFCAFCFLPSSLTLTLRVESRHCPIFPVEKRQGGQPIPRAIQQNCDCKGSALANCPAVKCDVAGIRFEVL